MLSKEQNVQVCDARDDAMKYQRLVTKISTNNYQTFAKRVRLLQSKFSALGGGQGALTAYS